MRPDPEWNKATRVHDWRNHAPQPVKELWPTFTDQQRTALEAWAETLASAEEWE